MSAATIFAGLVVSGLGFVLFTYGKRETEFLPLLMGLGLMACPMFVPGAIANYAIGALCIAALWASKRF